MARRVEKDGEKEQKIKDMRRTRERKIVEERGRG